MLMMLQGIISPSKKRGTSRYRNSGGGLLLAGAVASLCVLPSANTIQAQRAIPDDNLAYPVLIQFPDELASGFYLETDTSIYLVTAKHVLFDPPTGNHPTAHVHSGLMTLLSYPRDPKESGTNVILIDTAALSQAGEIKGNPVADVAVVRVADVLASPTDKGVGGQVRLIPGATARTTVASGLLGLNLKTIKKYDDVLVANEVLLFGYPTSLGIQGTPQLDPLRPLLRRGIVAGLNPNGQSIIIDCPSYPGNSGGPVVEADRTPFSSNFNVIGVVSQFVPFEEKSVNYPI